MQESNILSNYCIQFIVLAFISTVVTLIQLCAFIGLNYSNTGKHYSWTMCNNSYVTIQKHVFIQHYIKIMKQPTLQSSLNTILTCLFFTQDDIHPSMVALQPLLGSGLPSYCSHRMISTNLKCYPDQALASLKRHLHSSLSSAHLLDPIITWICDVSLRTTSSHLVLSFIG